MKMRRGLFTLLTMLLVLSLLPIFVYNNSYIMHILIMCLIWGGVAAAWDLIMGYAGIFTFGQFAFFVSGAYGSGILTKSLGISPWVGILTGGSIAGLLGIIIGVPCLRLRGVYIALVTFALHLILVPLIKAGRPIGTGGATGLLGIPPLHVGGYVFSALERVPWYYAALAISFLVFFAIYKIIHSSFGLAFTALRDAEDFARSLGVSDYKCNLMVFGISAFFTGIIGAFYAHYVSIISTRILGLDIFLLVMVMLVVGGMGKFPGAIIGAFCVTFLNEALRPLGTFRLIIFGALVVLSVVLMPQGLMGVFDSFINRRREPLKEKNRVSKSERRKTEYGNS